MMWIWGAEAFLATVGFILYPIMTVIIVAASLAITYTASIYIVAVQHLMLFHGIIHASGGIAVSVGFVLGQIAAEAI